MRFIFLLLLCGPFFAFAEEDLLLIEDGGITRSFEVACDELQCHPVNGSTAHPVQTPDQTTVTGILNHASALKKSTGNDFDLVLYETGKKRGLQSRRILTRRVLLTGIADSKAIPLPEGSTIASPAYAPEHFIITFPESSDVLPSLAALRALPGVQSAQPLLAKMRRKRLIPNDPQFAYSAGNPHYQWHLNNTGENGGTIGIDARVTNVWDQFTGTGIKIGIVDDGLETAHPDLAPNVDTALDHNWNSGPANDPNPNDSFLDHGTSCAGVAAAKGNNSLGVSGVAPNATLVGLRLIAEEVSDDLEAEALNWRNDVIEVKSNSWGPDDTGDILEDAGPLTKAAFQNSTQTGRNGKGTIFLWAAGNGGSGDNVNADGYANSIYTIAVGAVNDRGERAVYSEPGAAKLISTPSDDEGTQQGITTTTLVENGSYTNEFGGTSSATPLAAGVVALILEANPDLGWRDVQEVLITSARMINPSDPGWSINGSGFHFNHDLGAGLIDAAAAVALAQSWDNLPPQTNHSLANNSLALAIPDNNEIGVETTFDLTPMGDFRVEHVTVTINLTHPARGDLQISLLSPDGTESRLTEAHQDNNSDFSDWRLMSVHHWGENSSGLWRLQVRDLGNRDLGTLNSATLTVFGAPFVPITEAPEFTNAENTSGNQGRNFSFQISAKHQPETITVSDLPNGLSYDSLSRFITGIPEMEGIYEVTVSATNSIGTTQQSLTITVDPRIPTPPTLPGTLATTVLVGKPFSYQIPATNAPLTFSSTPLPAWLSLNSSTGILSGTPPAQGSVKPTVTATNPDGSASTQLTLFFLDPSFDPLAIALDTTEFIFTQSGNADWIPQSTTTYFGSEALRSSLIDDFEDVTLTTTIQGPAKLAFFWKVSSEEDYDELLVLVDGIPALSISGETDWEEGNAVIPPGNHTVSWSYRKDGDNSDGQDRAWLDRITLIPGDTTRELENSLDYRGLVWEGRETWTGQSAITHDGIDAAVSPPISNNTKTRLATTVTGPGTLTFWWKASTEAEYDLFQFSVRGTLITEISGQKNWTKITYEIPSGTSLLEWCYRKDESSSAGGDRVWLDEVIWRPTGITDLALWTAQNLAPGELLSADPDHDGRSHLLEYALNSNPHLAGTENEPVLLIAPDQDSFTYLADTSKPDISYRLAASTNLLDWLPLPTVTLSTNGVIETRRSQSPHSTSKRYFRLEIDLIPK